MAATSAVLIANRALQKLGSSRIEAIGEDTPNGRTMETAYDFVRLWLLRKYSWNFAIARASIAADAAKTEFGDLNRYLKPNDFLRLLRNNEPSSLYNDERHDWQIEGKYIVTRDGSPLQFRYIRDVQDPALFDPAFAAAFVALLAYETNEEVTGSNTKKDHLKDDFVQAIAEARQMNSFENDAEITAEDEWLIVRR